MRKNYLLLVALVSLLLVGCLGGRTSYVYDGSPTALEVVIKRDGVGPMAVDLNPMDTDFANIRVWKTNEAGEITYSIVKAVPLEMLNEEYTLSTMVPAEKAYNVTAIFGDGKGRFETGESIVDAPAHTLTTTNISLRSVDYVLRVPERVYSGGSVNQFKVEPAGLQDSLEFVVYLGTTPWTTNGSTDYQWFTSERAPQYFYEITEPRKLYYQVIVRAKNNTFKYIRPTAFFPNLANNEELPYIMFYPSPEYDEATK